MKFDKDLVAASATPLILAIVAESGESGSYGYEIIKVVRERSDEQMQWTEGMLYPVLHRLDGQKFIESFWRVATDTGRRRKYYRITRKGTEEIDRLKTQWEFVDNVLRSSWKSMFCIPSPIPVN